MNRKSFLKKLSLLPIIPFLNVGNLFGKKDEDELVKISGTIKVHNDLPTDEEIYYSDCDTITLGGLKPNDKYNVQWRIKDAIDVPVEMKYISFFPNKKSNLLL